MKTFLCLLLSFFSISQAQALDMRSCIEMKIPGYQYDKSVLNLGSYRLQSKSYKDMLDQEIINGFQMAAYSGNPAGKKINDKNGVIVIFIFEWSEKAHQEIQRQGANKSALLNQYIPEPFREHLIGRSSIEGVGDISLVYTVNLDQIAENKTNTNIIFHQAVALRGKYMYVVAHSHLSHQKPSNEARQLTLNIIAEVDARVQGKNSVWYARDSSGDMISSLQPWLVGVKARILKKGRTNAEKKVETATRMISMLLVGSGIAAAAANSIAGGLVGNLFKG